MWFASQSIPQRATYKLPLNLALDIMRVAVTIEISNQLSEVLSVIERHLESTLLAVHLYGSAVDGRPEAIQRY
ncbi:hypothetical protein EIMP300_01670 [Escherichia coli]|uniref:Uncharacterized protein n=1 Tax=Escherichia coli TaxID=562 RepID=A0A8S0FEE2_ECOLX|nr:hypothetical protein EIMP300_01670 [Escherichia coli]